MTMNLMMNKYTVTIPFAPTGTYELRQQRQVSKTSRDDTRASSASQPWSSFGQAHRDWPRRRGASETARNYPMRRSWPWVLLFIGAKFSTGGDRPHNKTEQSWHRYGNFSCAKRYPSVVLLRQRNSRGRCGRAAASVIRRRWPSEAGQRCTEVSMVKGQNNTAKTLLQSPIDAIKPSNSYFYRRTAAAEAICCGRDREAPEKRRRP